MRPGFYTPRKGSRQRQIMLRMLTPEGITDMQAVEAGLCKNRTSVGAIRERMYDLGGWDIRGVPAPNPRWKPKAKMRTHVLHYKIMGRYNADGKYRPLRPEARPVR